MAINLGFDPVTEDIIERDEEFSASMAPIYFKSFGSKILGTMFIASGKGPNPTILMLNGFPGNEINFDIAHMLRRQGYNVLNFYYRGSWGSEGEYSWKNILEDGKASIEFLKNEKIAEYFRIDKNKISLIGYSMGGFNAFYNAAMHDEIKNVVFIAGSNAGAFGEIVASNKSIYDYAFTNMLPAMEIVKCNSPKALLDEMIEKKTNWNLLNHIEQLSKKNILMIGAKYDSLVPLELNHIPIVEELKKVNTNLTEAILETGHSFSDKRIKLMRLISEWFLKIEE